MKGVVLCSLLLGFLCVYVFSNDWYPVRKYYWFENSVTKYNKSKKLGFSFDKFLCMIKFAFDWYFSRRNTPYEIGGYATGGSAAKANYENMNTKTALVYHNADFNSRKSLMNFLLRQSDFQNPKAKLSMYVVCDGIDTKDSNAPKSVLFVPQIGGTFFHGFLEFPGEGFVMSKCNKAFDYKKLKDYALFEVDVEDIEEDVDPFSCSKNVRRFSGS